MRTVTATALTPLFLGGEPEAGNVTPGLGHVPGSVLRGALAARWIRDHGTPDRVSDTERDEFRRLFDGAMAYRALRPAGAVVVPISVRRCKYDPSCEGAVDLLHDEDAVACPACDGSLDGGGKGEVVGGPRLVERTMTQLTVEGTPEEGNLFSRFGLPAGTKLSGVVAGDDAWLDALAGEVVWFGGKRSAAGRVRLSVDAATQPAPDQRDDRLVAVTLAAPAIIVDDAGRPQPSFPVADLEAVLGVGLEVERQWVRTAQVGGWHAASGLPKPAEHALGPGSSLLLHAAEPPYPDRLGALATGGIGLRRNEGFGEVWVNPPRWTPPEPPGADRGAAEPVPVPEPAAVAVVDRLEQRLRNEHPDDWLDHLAWLVDLAKDAALNVESGGPGLGRRALGQRRVRTWAPALRNDVEVLASGGSVRGDPVNEESATSGDPLEFLQNAIVLLSGAVATGRRGR